MTDFKLNPDMLTFGGVFYPKGYMFIMFPLESDAQQVAANLNKLSEKPEVTLLTPATVLREVGQVDGDSDVDLPSVGTEGATVRKYVQLARQGNSALMVKADSDEVAERVMVEVRKVPFTYGQRYHLLAMEDLE
jgi:hypothetical protein